MSDSLERLGHALSHDTPDAESLSLACTCFQDMVGHKLFTATAIHPDGDHVVRLYSNLEGDYASDGKKPVTKDGWHHQVIEQGLPFRGETIEDVKDYFPDHEKISAMGLGAVLNLPVLHQGEVLGTINLLDADHAYSQEDADKAFILAQVLAPVFISFRSRQV